MNSSRRREWTSYHTLRSLCYRLSGSSQGFYHLGILLLLAFIYMNMLPVFGDLASDQAALWSFRSAVAPENSMQWDLAVSPCKWRGIQCVDGSVGTIRMSGAGLAGPIPEGSLGNLTELRILSLRSNTLSGLLPDDLRKCTNLRRLYLEDNNFSGPLPTDFSFWPNLSRLNLANNKFSGNIPSSLKNLTHLETLYLQNNSLAGSLPDLTLPSLVQFSVANNNLSGPVPNGMANKFSADEFSGNQLCGPPLALPCTGRLTSPAGAPKSLSFPPLSSTRHKSKKLSTGVIIAIVIGGVIGSMVLLFLFLRFCRTSCGSRSATGKNDKSIDPSTANKRDDSVSVVQTEPEHSKLVFFEGAPYFFNLEDLLRASAEVLGKGSIGTAYKAAMEDGVIVVVKRLKGVTTARKEFEEQIQAIGRLHHPNLVPLRAYYFSKDEKLLVYDYLPMGSLSALLHGNRSAGLTPLDWATRFRIAIGTARGLAFLHEQGGNPGLVHGNIRSCNVLLDQELNACVSDFGLAQIYGSTAVASRVLGYRAPEVADMRRETQKSDVYSFGVLLLELLTGKAPTQASLNDEGIDLPRWVQSVVREEWTAEVFDLELMKYLNNEEEMVQVLQIALACVAAFPDQRPKMRQVLKMIEEVRRVDSGYGSRASEEVG